MSSTNGAWLDLQELYSSINYLKAKLNTTDQKLRAASSEEPVRVDRHGIPRMAAHSPTTSRRSEVGTSTRCRAAHVRQQRLPWSREGRSVYVDPVCINENERRDPVDPFDPVVGLERCGSLLEGQRRVAEGSCISRGISLKSRTDMLKNIVERQKRDADARSGGPRSCRTTLAVRAEDVYGTVASPHFLSSHSANAAESMYGQVDEPPKTQNNGHRLKTREVTRAKNGQSPFGYPTLPVCEASTMTSVLLEDALNGDARDRCAGRRSRAERGSVFAGAGLASNVDAPMAPHGRQTNLCITRHNVQGCRNGWNERELLGDIYVDDYLGFVESKKGRESSVGIEADRVSRVVEPQSVVPMPSLRKQESPVTVTPKDRVEDGEPAVPKRKVALVPKAKGYPGFTHVETVKMVRKIKRIAPKPLPIAVPLSKPPLKNKVPSPEMASGKGGKKSVITPTSWKAGRHFVPKTHISPPVEQMMDGDVREPVKEATEADILANKENTNFANVLAGLLDGASAHRSDDEVKGKGHRDEAEKANEKSVPRFCKLSKRKAQLHSALFPEFSSSSTSSGPQKTEQSPAPKVRHYDAAAVRDYIRQRKALRKRQEREARRSLNEASVAKGSRLESLYAFQRKVASASARIGQRKSLELQKEQEKEAAFLQSFKAQQDAKSDTSSDDGQTDETDTEDGVSPVGKHEIASQTEAVPEEKKAPLLKEGDSRHVTSTMSEASSSDGKAVELKRCVIDYYTELLNKAAMENPIPVPEFKYEPTPQLRHIHDLVVNINRAVDEELEHMGLCTTLQKHPRGHTSGDIATRLRQALSSFDNKSLLDFSVLSTIQSPTQTNQAAPGEVAPELPASVAVDVKHQAAQKIQRWYKKSRRRKFGPPQQQEQKTPEKEGLHVTQGPVQRCHSQDFQLSRDTVRRNEASEESFFHLEPEPYTFARAWKLKNLNRDFMTSTQSEGRLSPNFSLSSLEAEGTDETPKRQTERDGSRSVRRQQVDDTVVSITLPTDNVDGIAMPHEPTQAKKMDSSAMTKQSSESQPRSSLDELAADVGKANRSLEARQEEINQTEFFKPSSDIPCREVKGDENVWRLLDTQAEAVRASAEAVRWLAEARGPSLLQQQSEDLTRLLTASTVAAASALAASLTAEQGFIRHGVSAAQQTEPWKHSTSATSEYTKLSSVITSVEKSAMARCNETASEVPTDERNRCTAAEDTNVETLDFSELRSSDGEGSSEVKEGLKADISKKGKGGAHLQSPVSTDQESNDIRDNSTSSTSDPIILDKDLLSFSSLADPYFLALTLPSEEKTKLVLLRLQEMSLIQKSRAELAWLEVLKRKCRESGAEERVPALRKKQRGLLLKLHQKCAGLQLQQKKCIIEDHAQPKSSAAEGMTTDLDNSFSEQLIDPPTLSAASVHEELTSAHSVPESALKQEASDKIRGADMERVDPRSDAASIPSRGVEEKSAPFSLGASKRTLKEWQHQLTKRRKYVRELLEWQKELNIEEAEVRSLERQVASSLKVASGISSCQGATTGNLKAHREEANTTPTVKDVSSSSNTDWVLRGWNHSLVGMPAGRETSLVTESIEEDEEIRTEKESTASVPASDVYSASFEKDTESTSKSHAKDRLSPSREQRPPLNRGLMLRGPLLPMAKARRDSSGSEDSFSFFLSGPTSSQTETESEQSDVEGQILALKEELKRRQLEAAQLKKQQKRCRREFLRQKEQVLRKHIEMYDQLIEDAKAKLENEKIGYAASVKPQIKKPCVLEQQRQMSCDVHSGPMQPTGLSIKTAHSSEESSSKFSALHAASADEATEGIAGASTEGAASEGSNQEPSLERDARERSNEEPSLEQSSRTSEEVSNRSVGSKGTTRTSIPEEVASRADSERTTSIQNEKLQEPLGVIKRNMVINESLDVLVQKMALNAVISILHIGKEGGLMESDRIASGASKGVSTLCVSMSDVTKKVTSIMASLVHKKCHRELLHPQDMMVLSKDLDDDDLACQDSVVSEPQGGLQEDKEGPPSDEKEGASIGTAHSREEPSSEFSALHAPSTDEATHGIACASTEGEASERSSQERRLGQGSQTSQEVSDHNVGSGGTGHTSIPEEAATKADSEGATSVQNEKLQEPLGVLERNMALDESLNVLVQKMALNAVTSILDIGREGGLTESGRISSVVSKGWSTLCVDASDVTKKVTSIMASLVQKKSHRELLRPQDMMVLSTDLDDDDSACQDSVVSEPQGSFQQYTKYSLLSEVKEKEEPRQSDDCSALTIEQDWFEDDFGLSLPFSGEQFAYPRQIPNKPPPPYSPPKGGLAIPYKPSEPVMTSLFFEAKTRAVCKKSASVVFAAVIQGNDLDLLECHSLEIMPKEECRRDQVVVKCQHSFCTFLFDLTKEVARDMFSIDEVLPPPWQRNCSTRRKLQTPKDENRFVDLVSEKVFGLQHIGSKRTASAQLCAAARIERRKRADDTVDDEVDEAVNVVLQRELREEEPDWVDYGGDEVAVKELVADAIFVYLLDDVIRAFRALDSKW